MALDINYIKNKLDSLTKKNGKSNLVWKPSSEKTQIVRILPYKYNPNQNSFIELKFHYGLNKKNYISPSSFGRPDPICEFADSLMRNGNKDDWRKGRDLQPKLRTYVPIIVRGEESQGVKFWGFGKTVHEEIIRACSDESCGDITHLKTGRDITVEYIDADKSDTNFAKTKILVKMSISPASKDNPELLVENQTKITDMWVEPTYDELKSLLTEHLAADTGSTEEASVVDTSDNSATDKKLEELFAKKK